MVKNQLNGNLYGTKFMNRKGTLGIVVLLAAILGAGSAWYYERHQSSYPAYPDEVHVHSDFVLQITDQQIDLTDNRYQSYAGSVKHDDIHIHDNEDHVIHRHAEDITLVEFLASININLTSDCLTMDDGSEYCADENDELTLYVNGAQHKDPTTYINQEEDQLLLYYGPRNNDQLPNYLDAITDESCIYSGTCPERGIAPAESCGLSCEL